MGDKATGVLARAALGLMVCGIVSACCVPLVWAISSDESVAAPIITFPPTPQASFLGGRAIFTVIADGEDPLSYQWRHDGIDLVDGPHIAGATRDVLILSDLQSADAGGYGVVVASVFGGTTSVEAELVVDLPRGGDVDPSFDPGSSIDGEITAVVVQADGKLLIGGAFKTLSDAVRSGIARLNADGSVDHTFGNGLTGANGTVRSIVIQPSDGRILIGGDFTEVNGATRGRIARLNADGSLDTTFLDGLAGADAVVRSVALDPWWSWPELGVWIGGEFTAVNGVDRGHLARLNPDGSLDAMFAAETNGPVHSILVHAWNETIFIAGDFTAVNGVSRGRVAKVDTYDGGVLAFMSGGGANGAVHSLALQTDGKLLIGGDFTTVHGVSRNRVARLKSSDGSLDTTFLDSLGGASQTVWSLGLQPDGRLLIGGDFNAVNGVSRGRVARLATDGSLDTTFLDGLAGANRWVSAVTLQPDGRVVIGGIFTAFNAAGRVSIARLNADGSLDTTPLGAMDGPDYWVQALAVQPDGRVLIGGYFTSVNGVSRGHVARLAADGSLDTTFLDGLEGANGGVDSVALQSDGRVVIGGSFTAVNGMSRHGIARLLADGSVDASFLGGGLSGVSGPFVHTVVVQPDGRVLIGGSFSAVNGVSRNNIVRLNSDGSLDTTFLSGPGGPDERVYSIALQPDGRVLIAGQFSAIDGVSRHGVARLNPDGSLDGTFLDGLGGTPFMAWCLALQPDGHVLVGGYTFEGGDVVVRLDPDGNLDETLEAHVENENSYLKSVETLAVQPDGRVLIAGRFSSVDGVSRLDFARLNPDGSLDQTFLDGRAGPTGRIRSVVAQPDGLVTIAGMFQGVNDVPSSFVARLYRDVPVEPAIKEQPRNQASYEGCCAVFHVEAAGSPLSYRWRKDGTELMDGPAVSGAASPTLTVTGVSAVDAGAYGVVVSNVLGEATSDDAMLVVSTAPPCQVGSCDAELGCVLSDLSCDDGSTCTDDSCDPATGCLFSPNTASCDGIDACTTGGTCSEGECAGFVPLVCDDGNACTEDSCDPATGCAFTPAPGCPWIGFQPTPRATILGGRAIFTVIASGDAQSYRWRQDGHELEDGPGVEGATTDTLILSGLGFSAEGMYSVVVGNEFGSATSDDASLTVRRPRGGDVDFSFDPGSSINGEIKAIGVRPDGRVLIGGTFTAESGAARVAISRLATDGTTDHGFDGSVSGGDDPSVDALLAYPDGRVLIGGSFSTVNEVSRLNVARLDPAGGLDGSFVAWADGAVASLAEQPDGRVLIGGMFTAVNGWTRNRIARLNVDGSLDPTFLDDPAGANGSVRALALQPDGRVLIAGDFTKVNGTYRNRIARLDPDGSLDHTFLVGLAGANGAVQSVVLQPDGRVLIGGEFTTVNGLTRHSVARLHPDGSLDTTFLDGLAGVAYEVDALAVQPDGRVLIAGYFWEVNGVGRYNLARLHPDGSLDTTFLDGTGGPNGAVKAVVLQSDGRVLIGGQFTTVNGTSRRRVARLDADGSLDPTFVNGLAGLDHSNVRSTAAQPDGRVLIAGYFWEVNGASRNGIARLNADGSLDTTFGGDLVDPDSPVYAIAVQPDGRMLIGGHFSVVSGVSRSNLARLNVDGSLDTTFLDGLDGVEYEVYAIALQPDGRVLIGGTFGAVNGVSRQSLARLNPDGSLDTTFLDGLEGVSGTVFSIVVQPDGRVLIGGDFDTVNGVSRGDDVARLNADGSRDLTFVADMEGGFVDCLALQPDGRVLIGGWFLTVNGLTRNHIARLNADGSLDGTFADGLPGVDNQVLALALQPDGHVLIGGYFTRVHDVSSRGIARLNMDGSLDTTFPEGFATANDAVQSITVQADGRLLIGGSFGGVNGVPSAGIARLYGDIPVTPAITVQPANQLSYDGCCAVFHVEAAGTPLDYRWRQDGVDLANDEHVQGVTGPTLTVTTVSVADRGVYDVVVSNVLGGVTSDPATLSVASLPPCEAGVCDAELGCLLAPAPDGTACDDANPCTGIDTCLDLACQSSDCVCIIAPDADGDGFGDAGVATETCDPTVPPGQVANAGDCDDARSAVHPGATEICDYLRNDCSGAGWPALVDLDRDLVEDACDNCLASSNPAQADADGDALGSTCDDCRYAADTSQANSDADVHGDACDNCIFDANDAQTDTDGDAMGDACEIDADGDGVLEDDGDAAHDPCTGGASASCDDNCPRDANPLQEDADGDGVGDACDTCPMDSDAAQTDADRDGTGDACDPCTDSDGDDLCDPADVCPEDALDDADGDGVCGDRDNCPTRFNPRADCDSNPETQEDQCDADGDRVGDVCDNCPDDPNPGQDDADWVQEGGVGPGNACDPDMDGDGTSNEQDGDRDGDGVPEDDGDGIFDPCPDRVRLFCDDNCPEAQNGGQLDRDGNGLGNACDFADGEVGGATANKADRGETGSALMVLSWQPEAGAIAYNVYRGLAGALTAVDHGTCYRSGLEGTQVTIVEEPPAGRAYTYLVTAVTASGDGSLGADSDNVERVSAHACP